MIRFRLAAGALLLAGHLVALGCSTPKPEPEIASSAAQSGYAQRYPEELQSTATSFGEREELAKRAISQFPDYPDQLKKPAWSEVLEVVEQADAAGRGYDYVERVRSVDGAVAFFTDNKGEITKKVSGAAQYVARQKGHDLDVSGTVAHALDESVARQLEKYVRERNEAHRRIDRYRGSLGKENAEALEKQADKISFASYVVHVELVESKLRLSRMLEEIESVKRSIDDSIAAERKLQAAPGRTDEDKKASTARIEKLDLSKAQLDAASKQASQLKERIEERLTAVRKLYQEAFDKLDNTIRQRGGLPALPPREE
jgi:hypothetical protein